MSAYSYTLTNLLISVRALLKEETASFWTDAILTAYINEAIFVIAERTGCYRTTQSVSTAASTRLVAFTGFKCIAAEYSSKALIKITPLQVGHVPIDGIYPQYFFESGSNIGIEPIPSTICALTLYVANTPTALSAGSDVPLIPYSLCGLINYYAVSKALAQDKRFGAAAELMSIFNNDLEFMSRALLPNIPDGLDNLRFQ